MTEPALKAAFIYNFAKFTDWPQKVLPATAAFVMCVLGDPAVSDALTRTVSGRELVGHRISVSQVSAADPLTSCHILYLGGVSGADATRIVTPLRDVPVLTISDADGFARRGGMTEFFVEDGKMRFCINIESARRPRLQLSSKLLALARCPG